MSVSTPVTQSSTRAMVSKHVVNDYVDTVVNPVLFWFAFMTFGVWDVVSTTVIVGGLGGVEQNPFADAVFHAFQDVTGATLGASVFIPAVVLTLFVFTVVLTLLPKCFEPFNTVPGFHTRWLKLGLYAGTCLLGVFVTVNNTFWLIVLSV